MVTCRARRGRRKLFVPNTKAKTQAGSKELRAQARRAEVHRTECLDGALIDWRFTGLANGRGGARRGSACTRQTDSEA